MCTILKRNELCPRDYNEELTYDIWVNLHTHTERWKCVRVEFVKLP